MPIDLTGGGCTTIRHEKIVERIIRGDCRDEEKKRNEQRHAVIRFAPKEQYGKRETHQTARQIAHSNQGLKRHVEQPQTVGIGTDGLGNMAVIDGDCAEQNNRHQYRAYKPYRVRASHFTLLSKIYGHDEPYSQ